MFYINIFLIVVESFRWLKISAEKYSITKSVELSKVSHVSFDHFLYVSEEFYRIFRRMKLEDIPDVDLDDDGVFKSRLEKNSEFKILAMVEVTIAAELCISKAVSRRQRRK